MIYLLEDDSNIRKLIAYTLKSQGLDCLDFAIPSEFWKAFNEDKPDLALLDIMLPEEDGLSILKKIRSDKKTSSIPIIIITARDTEFDMVSGLDAGADDYITKPFGMMNLVARIKAVLRRYNNDNFNNEKSKKLKLNPIVVDLVKHQVFVDKEQIFLTVKEFELLSLLIENKDKVITREKLLNTIWNVDAEVESRTIDVHIRTLRHKLGKYGDYIETIRGVGYKISKADENVGDND